MKSCKSCVRRETCRKVYGNIFGYCETEYMNRQELEQTVREIVYSDMEIVLFTDEEEIEKQLKAATDLDLLEYMEE